MTSIKAHAKAFITQYFYQIQKAHATYTIFKKFTIIKFSDYKHVILSTGGHSITMYHLEMSL